MKVTNAVIPDYICLDACFQCAGLPKDNFGDPWNSILKVRYQAIFPLENIAVIIYDNVYKYVYTI